jgi:hypothetical protein
MDMREGRYYPTNVAHGDGTTYIFAGRDASGGSNPEVERFVPAGGPAGEDVIEYLANADNSMIWYPRMHLLPSGQIIRVGEERETEILDPATEQWSTVADSNFGRRKWGTSVMLPPGHERIMILGGHTGLTTWATNTAEIIDLTEPVPSWSYTAPMNYPRMHLNVVTLPDGKVFVAGGTQDDPQLIPAFVSEMFDPVSETWALMASQASARVYHSSAVLLPDARVMWLGAYADTGHNHDPTAQIFSPPYLFRGPQPVVSSSPDVADYGETFAIGTPDAAVIDKVVLIRPSATTHSTNMEQRYVELAFSQTGASTLEASVPTNPNVAPPGYYLLFLVDDDGVPSLAPWIRIGGDLPPTVDAGPDQSIVLPEVVQLDASVASENLPGVVTSWTVAAGPGPVVFADPSAVDTSATFTVPGDYELRLTATDGPLLASDSLDVSALPVGTVQTFETRVATPEDDAEEYWDGSISLTSTDLDLHDYAPAPHLAAGVRFIDVQIPPGVEIVDAWLEFEADATDSAPTFLTFRAEATADAAPFTATPNDLTSRATTAAAVSWDVAPWLDETSGPETRSPSLAAIVQEAVDQPGWARGNALAILITDGAGTSDRVAESFDGYGPAAALLHVEYVPEPGALLQLLSGLALVGLLRARRSRRH